MTSFTHQYESDTSGQLKKNSRFGDKPVYIFFFRTIVRDRDVNLRHILNTLTQNSDKFECLSVSKLTDES